MAIPIGLNALSSITRRHLQKEVVDQFYRSNVLFYRLNESGKKVIDGGTQIEQPLLWTRFDAATWYQGFDVLNTTPQDVLRNAAYDWKNLAVAITIDNPTLQKNDSPESIANLLTVYTEAARMEAEDKIGSGLFSDAVTNTKELDGFQGAIDNGTVAATYGGITNRTTTNAFWQPRAGALDTTTTTLSLAAMQTVFGAASDGARHPTVLIGTQANYNRYWNLLQVQQRFPSQPQGQDEQLAKAGFTNLLFNNVPFVVDSHVNTTRAGTTGDHLYFINEEFILLKVKRGQDMTMDDAVRPVNQDAFVIWLKWMGALVFSNLATHGLMSAITA